MSHVDDWIDEFAEHKDDAEIVGLVIGDEGFAAFADAARPEIIESHKRAAARAPWLLDPENIDGDVKRAWRTKIDDHNSALRAAHRQQKKRRHAFLARCPRHADVVLSPNFEETDAIRKLRSWHDDPKRCVAVLAGPVGTGKTTAAAWWAWHSAQDKALPQWVSAASYARSDRYGGERDKVFTEPLVLDDLGVEFQDRSGSFRTDFDELVDNFYSKNRSLVITTNLDATAFEARYGARVLDRIREAGVWIPVLGKSRRQR